MWEWPEFHSGRLRLKQVNIYEMIATLSRQKRGKNGHCTIHIWDEGHTRFFLDINDDTV
jgi:hypothetical protein